MRYVAYTSKLYYAAGLLVLSLFGFAVYSFGSRIPAWGQAVFYTGLGLLVLACLRGLCATRPVIAVDEDGVHYRKLFLKKIAWRDIAEIRQAPRSERHGDRSISFSLTDSSRPIILLIANAGKYMPPLLLALTRLSPVPTPPGCIRLQIDTLGTTANSTALYEALLHHADPKQRKS